MRLHKSRKETPYQPNSTSLRRESQFKCADRITSNERGLRRGGYIGRPVCAEKKFRVLEDPRTRKESRITPRSPLDNSRAVDLGEGKSLSQCLWRGGNSGARGRELGRLFKQERVILTTLSKTDHSRKTELVFTPYR